MKKQLDLIITGGEVFLPNSSIEKIDIGIKDSKIVELGDLSKKDCEKKNSCKQFNRVTWSN